MGNTGMDTFMNSDDPNEMPHYATFHHGLHSSGKKNFRLKNTFFLLKL